MSMTNDQVLAAFQACDALCKGHFKLTSGQHSDTYFQCARVLEHPRLTGELAAELVTRLPEGIAVDMVASPAVGGILFGFAMATALDTSLVFSERVEGRMVLRRSFVIPQGTRVLVAEDVVTTGGSVQELLALIRNAGAEPVAVVSLVDRGKNPDFGCPFIPLLRIETPSWLPEDCELCKAGKELDAPGSRNLSQAAGAGQQELGSRPCQIER